MRIKNALARANSNVLKEGKMLEQLVDTKKQKVVLKPDHEYFSSSHTDVFQNRLLDKAK